MGTGVSVRFEDKKGNPFKVTDCFEKDFHGLTEMYAHFSPKPASQGIPPAGTEACRRWVKGLLEEGENFLALRGDRVIGHVALLPDPEKKTSEFLIFVDRSARNRGVGKALTQIALDRARTMGITDIWLSVEAYNFRAISLYKRFDFTFRDRNDCERTMTCRL